MTRFQRRFFSTATHLIIYGSLRRGPRFPVMTAKIGWFLFLLGIAASSFGLWLLLHAIPSNPDHAIITQNDGAQGTLAPLVAGFGGIVVAGFGLFVVALSKIMRWLVS